MPPDTDRLPVLLMYVRLASVHPIVNLEALRDDLKTFLDAHADLWGLRVKRRQVTRDQLTALFEVYEDRAAATETATRTRRKR